MKDWVIIFIVIASLVSFIIIVGEVGALYNDSASLVTSLIMAVLSILIAIYFSTKSDITLNNIENKINSANEGINQLRGWLEEGEGTRKIPPNFINKGSIIQGGMRK